MIKKICIENVKGFGIRKCFDLNIYPNKPNILVAPNGFGKSSLTTAFNSLNNNRIDLHKNHRYEEDESKQPFLSIEYEQNGTTVTLSANESSNTISGIFDIFVINNKVEAKANNMRLPSGGSRAVASMEIKPIVLIQTIPQRANISYSVTSARLILSENKTVLPNIAILFNENKFLEKLSQDFTILDRSRNITPQRKVNNLLELISLRTGSVTEILLWLENEKLTDLQDIEYISDIAQMVYEYSSFDYNLTESYLVAIQVSNVYNSDKDTFKKTCKYKLYEIEKKGYEDIFGFFKSTWKNIRPTVKDGSLILSLPKVHQISNGQRDVWTFIALLQKAKNHFKKDHCILIIDEVFDYLDDANLTAVQFYISNLIKDLKNEGKNFYPLILTHLNPVYFKNFTFQNQHVYYLDNQNTAINENMKKLIINRKKFEEIHDEIKVDKLSKYFLHYEPESLDLTNKFSEYRLHINWGISSNFYHFVLNQVNEYLNDRAFCAFSVCCGVRIKIEEKTYLSIEDPEIRTNFLIEHGTKKKLEYVQEKGIDVSDIYFLLGVIYNDGLHWKNNYDNVSPIISKLNNLTIKNMIKKVFE